MPYSVLKKCFGYDEFRPGQKEIIDAILQGRDVLAVMPTGAGKSICYQIPALLMPGITVVVSPLISLMQDQVKALNDAGVHAAYINSSLSEGQITAALRYAAAGRYKIIYVAPERLGTEMFIRFAMQAEISMVTVDEAHCISQWGQDFRPSYLRIVDFIRMLRVRPVISAFTATATPEVKDDIMCTLNLENPKILVSGFDRPNLYFEVVTGARKDDFVLDYVKNHPGDSGIIYCATRKNTDSLFELLFRAGVRVSRYHAGMDTEERKRSQEDFVYDRTPVMVATNAFGMGIDKSNVRYVIHYNMPQSMENYYQEAGRAGRDGEDARCILLFSSQDVMIDRMLLDRKDFSAVDPADIEGIQEHDRERLRAMETYCQTTGCLRCYILKYFGEQAVPCGNCSNCDRDFEEEDVTAEAKAIVACVKETRGRYGINIVTGILTGAGRARLKEIGAENYGMYGRLKDTGEGTLRMVIPQLVERGILVLTDDRYPVLRLGPNASELQDNSARVTVKVRADKKKTEAVSTKKPQRRKKSTDDLTSRGYRMFEALRAVRTELACEANLPPYIVFSDKTLIDMCVKEPKNRAEMLEVNGVGAAKFEKYGERFLSAIREFAEG